MAGLEGLAELEAVLAELPDRIAKGAVRRSLRRGAEVIAEAWRENARVLSGRFKGHIAVSSQATAMGEGATVRRRAREQGNEALAYVGPTKEAYPEAMTEEFKVYSNGVNAPGRRAWEATKDAALDAIAADLGPEIEKTAARYRKRRLKAGG
ncbi:MAG: hypothetical protein ACJ8DZ_06350 [Allosphingosinicella sp.]